MTDSPLGDMSGVPCAACGHCDTHTQAYGCMNSPRPRTGLRCGCARWVKPVEPDKLDGRTLVTNFFAGPGTGKSTMMAHVFALLKWRGVSCEMAHEWVKGKVWEGHAGILESQIYIFAKQLHTIRRLCGRVDVILCDAPLLMSLMYGRDEHTTFKALVEHEHDQHRNMNVMLGRCKPYDPAGRVQTEAQARGLDDEIKDILIGREGLHGTISIPAEPEYAEHMVTLIQARLEHGANSWPIGDDDIPIPPASTS